MDLYKRIAMINLSEDRDDLTDELYDRFGEMPKPASNLLDIAYIRALAMKCGVIKIDQVGTEVHIYPVKFDWTVWSELSRANGGKIKVIMSSSPYLNYRFSGNDKIIPAIEKLFEEYLRLEKELGEGE